MKKYELINKSFISFLIFFVFLSFIFIFFKFNFLFVSFLFFLILFTLGGRVGLNKGGQKYFFYIILNAMVLYFFAVFTIVLILKSYAVFIIFPIFIYTVLDYIFFEIKLEKILIKFFKRGFICFG